MAVVCIGSVLGAIAGIAVGLGAVAADAAGDRLWHEELDRLGK